MSMKEFLEKLLLLECPVKYYDGSEGNAVPLELIEKRIKELEE